MARTNKRPRNNLTNEISRQLHVISTNGVEDYDLLDSGNGRKLERFGVIVIDRPEPQALWQPQLDGDRWQSAHAYYSARDEDENSKPGSKGRWRINKPVPESWPVRIGDITVMCRLQGLWHLGLFPEQAPHWIWIERQLNEIKSAKGDPTRPRVLNLFAYTGAASLIAAKAGAEVTHVDASKKAVAWAKENQEASSLSQAPIRWIVDDAQKFVAREVRRGKRYDLIVVDPPKFGRGPSGETWDLFEDLAPLLENCKILLDNDQKNSTPAAMALTVYAIRASALAFEQLCQQVLSDLGGSFESGELIIAPRGNQRVISTSLFTRWRR